MFEGNYSWSEQYVTRPIRSIVEVGSRDGLDAIAVSRHFGAPVIAFEPNPDSFSTCLENVEQQDIDSVSVRQEALSDINGEISFWQIDSEKYGNVGASSLFEIDFRNRRLDDPDYLRESVQKKITVQAVRWDSLGLAPPDLLLLDVEGAELKVLKGFGSQLDGVSYVVSEAAWVSNLVGGTSFRELDKFLSSRGFQFVATNKWGRDKEAMLRKSRRVSRRNRMRRPFGKPVFQGQFDVIYERR